MANIYDCVNSFYKLLNVQYKINIGRKGVMVQININFDKRDCFHLMGLQYLVDRPDLKKDREKLFDEIMYHQIDAVDYSMNQATWTLLCKEKKNIVNGNSVILYNRIAAK